MKSNLFILWAALLAAVSACGPQNEEVTTGQVDLGPPREALDTVANTRKDAVATDENEITPTLPLPQPVLQLLTQHYPGWQQPTLTEETKEQAANYEQGPTLVRGDFNSDSLQDYALQLQQDRNIIVAAFVSNGGDNWRVHELRQDILFNDRGQLKSLYYVYLVEQGEALHNDETNQKFEAPHDAIAVGIENSAATYVYQNGEFQEFSTAD